METQNHETTPILLAVRSFRINVAQEATHGTSDVAINLISYQIAFSRSKCPRGAQRA